MASTTPIAILSSLSTAPLKNLQNSSQNYIETKILAQHNQRVIPPT